MALKTKHFVTPAQATVKLLGKEIGGGGGWYEVTVQTAPGWPLPKTRVYTMRARSDNVAALDGLHRFEEELREPKPSVVH